MKTEDFAFPAMLFALILTIALVDMYISGGYEMVGCSVDSDCRLIYNDCTCEAVLTNDERGTLEGSQECRVNECSIKGVRAVCNDRQVCVKGDGPSDPVFKSKGLKL